MQNWMKVNFGIHPVDRPVSEAEQYPEKRALWLRSYLQTYLERDILKLGNVSDPHSFESLVNVCAAKHSQELNIAALSRTTGVASLTAKKWIGLLESCYLLYYEPFHSNLGKRIVKSAKLYSRIRHWQAI